MYLPRVCLTWLGTVIDRRILQNLCFSSCLIRAFIGYSNANYALSEVRNPVQTIKRAAPLALILVSVAYISVNVAYYAVVSKADILDSGTVAA